MVQSYGLLEQSVDSILIRTAELYGDICASYDDLPTRVRNEFRTLALQSILEGERARLRSPIDESVVLLSLAPSTSPELRRLVAPVFTRSQANYRHPLVREMFLRLDVTVKEPANSGVSDELNLLGKASIASVILDLVERRNELAHAYAIPDDILSSDQIIAVVNVVEAYLCDVEEASNSRLLAESERVDAALRVGPVARMWSHAVGIDASDGVLAVGDHLLFRRTGGSYLTRQVASLMLDHAAVEHVDATSSVTALEVGVGFAGPAPRRLEGAIAFLLPEKLHDLLPILEA
ncbi:hypothetical protein [Cellulomonas phragmiteti]